MVIVGRGWLAEAGRAARDNRALYTRLLFLSGIIAVAWLAGGIGVAHGDAVPESGDVTDLGIAVEDAEDTADEEVHGSRLSDTAARTVETTESLTGEIATEVTALTAEGTGVSTVLDRTTTGSAAGQVVDEASQAVDATARGAGDLVEGVVHTGQETVEDPEGSLRESGLVDAIADGLSEPARVADHRVGEAMTTEALADPRVGDGQAPPDVSEPVREGQESDEAEEASPTEELAALAETPSWQNSSQWRTIAEETTEQAGPAEGGDLGERIRLLGGGAHHSAGADSTGASAQSFSGPGAAGFLMARVDHLAAPVQQVVLPGDSAPVVRDAADDPSYSPD